MLSGANIGQIRRFCHHLTFFKKIQYAVNQMVVIQLKCKVMTPADVNGFRGMFADSH